MLDIETIEDQDCFIPHVTLSAFVDAVARFSGEENLGLLLAPYLSIASKGCWGDYILAAPTLGAAFDRGATTIGFHSRGDAFLVSYNDGQVRLGYTSPAKGKEGYSHIACGTEPLAWSSV